MTNKDAIIMLKNLKNSNGMSTGYTSGFHECMDIAIQALDQEHSRDMEEIREVMSCDADAETKCKMISNILSAKPHYFKS